ncbi:MAG: T9SS type A sorting domain-containing protein, partial [Bacteroidetes bacterium]|nr:T9SS type A sorting domain-containing protein [Bacteroidota bacterium]
TADYVVSLMDIQGRIVSTMNLNNASGSQTLAFGTENLAKGSYVVAISSNGFKTTKHVVIK